MEKTYIFNETEKTIVCVLFENKRVSSSFVHRELSRDKKISLVTVKRALSKLLLEGIVSVFGKGRSVTYDMSVYGRLVTPVNEKKYSSADPDRRYGESAYNFELFDAMPGDLFSAAEHERLREATEYYRSRIAKISETVHKKELERFVIELSWKSSKIEGNTYTLLDTEKLIQSGVRAPGKTKDEAVMILNHKEAFSFVLKNRNSFKNLSRANLEELHKIIVKGLNVKMNLRSGPVGVTGSLYKPLDNVHQISEAVECLVAAVGRADNGYSKALIALLGISYIQPFEDGNKRTARIMANAILLAHDLAPISYRSVDENHYREATLVLYELNSMVPLKNIFVEQYEFAARNYLVN